MLVSHCIAETSRPAATMALGDGSRNDGMLNSRHAPSHTTMSATKAVAGASRSAHRRNCAPTAALPGFASGGGTGKELAADMVCERMKPRVRESRNRARARQIDVNDFPHTTWPRRHDDDAVGE